ncbi:amidohydrolase family protein [Gallaecimonas sp. GXIMD4217]|uniref:Xaa-Pro dipeptidase n=1 Tax=Gallaecimonas sp. GXIMD4217 TaxID=3131927 RepID=UPI00311AE9B4
MKTLLLSLGLTATPALAQSWYITADHYFNSESGELVSPATLIVDGNRISAVGSELPRPEGSRRLDLSGHTLLPGLIDMHVHLTLSENLHGYRRLGLSVPRQALIGAKNARRTLDAGITTVRNLGAGGYADIALRDAIAAGDVPGPRIFASGPAIGITGGHCDNNLLAPEYRASGQGTADGPWAVRARVRENIKYGADVIKLCATGGVLSKGTKVGVQQLTEEEMAAAVAEAHRRGLSVAAHAHGTGGIKAAIRAGVDTIEHASFLDGEAIRLAKANGTYLSMDIYDTEYILAEGIKAGMLPESIDKEKHTGQQQRDSFHRAAQAGVPMLFGTDAAVYPHGDNMKQLSRMVTFGLSPAEALQSATWHPARVLGRDDLGSLKAGALADVIAVPGNPLENITLMEKVSLVMKDGELIRAPQ